MTYLEVAKQAYEGYAAVTNWKNFQGAAMPEWDDLPKTIQQAWIGASATVTDVVLNNVEEATKMAQTEIVPSSTTI